MSGPHLDQSQSLQQQQRITPQMQQSLQVLQAATVDLKQLVQQEMAVNPVLEDDSVEISLEDQDLGEDDFDKEFAELSQLDEEWREYMAQSRRQAPRSAEAEEKRQFMFDSIAVVETLQEHLLRQLGTSEATDHIRDLAEIIIGNIDSNGFVQAPEASYGGHLSVIENLSLAMGLPIDPLRQALEIVQSFDPPGVGAQDLRDCLLIQLKRMDKEHSLEFRVVDNHLEDLARKRYPQIARKLGVETADISRTAKSIATLNPRPGREFAVSTNQYVTPDVEVIRDGNDFVVTLNNEQIPHLRISNQYKELMAGAGNSRDVKQYVRDKVRSGKFLIKSIHQRQETIKNITEEIVRRQRGFFTKGPSHLKPMNMASVAETVGVHETTVSRAISGKYIATPYGVFEMKHFFSTGYETASGETLAKGVVQAAIAELVKGEDPRKPLSDDKIVEKMREKGLKIARRTVAKYRDGLNILPSHLRKGY